MTGVRILLLPGWQNSGPDHWQSHWQRRQGFARVEQDDWLWPRRGDWMARLEDELLADDGPVQPPPRLATRPAPNPTSQPAVHPTARPAAPPPAHPPSTGPAGHQPVVLVAHSLGCHLAAAWAAHSQITHRVAAALLVAPPDLLRADLPEPVRPWARPGTDAATPPTLPFPSTLVFSSDDPYCSPVRAQTMARQWGAEPHPLGAAGHINAASGLGDWPAGLALLRQLLARTGLPALLTADLLGEAPGAAADLA